MQADNACIRLIASLACVTERQTHAMEQKRAIHVATTQSATLILLAAQ